MLSQNDCSTFLSKSDVFSHTYSTNQLQLKWQKLHACVVLLFVQKWYVPTSFTNNPVL